MLGKNLQEHLINVNELIWTIILDLIGKPNNFKQYFSTW